MPPTFFRSVHSIGQASLLALLLAATGIMPARAQDVAPDYGPFRESVFLPYLDAEAEGLHKVPQLGLSFGSRTYRAVLDTGSTGVVVAAALIPDFDQLPSTGEGRLTYTSSGRVMIGRWVVAPLTLAGADGAQVKTEPMPVLAVTRIECLRQSRDCAPQDDPRDIAMIGIGFAREHDRQTQSTPDKNPLLRVRSEAGEQRQGYVVTASGIHVGLSAASTRGPFHFVKLQRQTDLPDWAPVAACISVDRQEPAACGTMLVDTGVPDMFLTVPGSQADGQRRDLAAGTEISISLGSPASQSPLYRFVVGDRSVLAPSRIHLTVSDRTAFVNTSYHFLNGFDLLYDADGGYAGFRRR